MSAPSQDIEVLLATLAATEAHLRHLIAETTPLRVAWRIEQRSTAAARAALHAVRVERRIDLPPGWAEHVEVDEEIDALLARLIHADPPVEATFAARAEIAPVPPLPADLDRKSVV